MKLLFVLVALATTFSTAAAQGTPASANTAAKSSANSGSQPKGAKVVVSPGGQGHNSGPDPKGKILVAPTTSTPKGKQTSQTNAASKPPQ